MFLGGRYVNLELLKAGTGYVYRDYLPGRDASLYLDAESPAREVLVGVLEVCRGAAALGFQEVALMIQGQRREDSPLKFIPDFLPRSLIDLNAPPLLEAASVRWPTKEVQTHLRLHELQVPTILGLWVLVP